MSGKTHLDAEIHQNNDIEKYDFKIYLMYRAS